MRNFVLYNIVKIRKNPCTGKMFAKQNCKLTFLAMRQGFFHQSWLYYHYGEFPLKVEKLEILLLTDFARLWPHTII